MKKRLALLALLALLPAARAAQAPPAPAFAFEQHLGAKLPLGLRFVHADGRSAPLAGEFGGPPVVLVFGYLDCPNLCDTARLGAAEALRESGRPARALFVSIDPHERLAPPSPWRLLKGDEAAVRRLADAVGFHYAYDAGAKQYLHPAGFVVATPEGVVSRYFPGVRFDAAEVREALDDAAHGRTGSLAGNLLLLCRHLAPQGRYSGTILALLQAAIALFLAAGGVFLWRMRKP